MTVVALPVRAILVALDDSDRAPLVFATAAMRARCLGAQLFPLHVIVLSSAEPPAAHTPRGGTEEGLLRNARASLQALMRGEAAVLYGSPIVVFGDPWREIVENAATFDVDLIVIGARQRHGDRDRVLGTVATNVISHTDRNVLMVQERGAVRDARS